MLTLVDYEIGWRYLASFYIYMYEKHEKRNANGLRHRRWRRVSMWHDLQCRPLSSLPLYASGLTGKCALCAKETFHKRKKASINKET